MRKWHFVSRSTFASRTSLVAQMVKCLSRMQETWVWALGWEDPLEKEMAIHSSTIDWKIPWIEEPGRLQSMGSVRHDWAISLAFRNPCSWAWRVCWRAFSKIRGGRQRSLGSYIQSIGSHRVRHDWSDLVRKHLHTQRHFMDMCYELLSWREDE